MAGLEHPSARDLFLVAEALQDLADEVVFVGGSVIPVLVPTLHADGIRVTDDVDCVVRVRTYSEYAGVFSERLRHLGFRECRDEGAPLCRWTIGKIRVDLMPCDEAALGLTNRWFDECLANPQAVDVGGRQIRVPALPVLIATKLEAYRDRGRSPLGERRQLLLPIGDNYNYRSW